MNPGEAPLLSVVLPMYNEAQVVEECLRTLRQRLEGVGKPFEIVCVDDGSTDATSQILDREAGNDARVRVASLSRNFGKEAAMAAGLELARGQAVLLMDADLQHPPELIPQMVALWEQG